ncbi:hypothetical protein GF415_02075 [Candidatus Micrarchaeota archaeon]|nr:hypothetical protein [Candidatus Micrarchaeota archaeon]
MRYMPLVIMLLLPFVSGCLGPAEELPQISGNATRSYYVGLVPSPKTQPETSFEDIVDAYEEAGRLGEVMMVWSDPNCIGQCTRLRQTRVVEAARSNGMEPVLTLNFATLSKSPGKGFQYGVCWPNHTAANITDPKFRKAWVNEAKTLAEEFRPSYFSLGNEVNDYFYLHPEDLPHYITLYDEAYTEIKKVSPETKVFVVFSYTHLLDNSQWGLLEEFDNRSDIIGLTTYPWKHYSSPQKLPPGYYRRINSYTNKPIAFTEIGWPSTGSEYEQAEFLGVFQNRTEGMDLEMVNWLFLHEVSLEGDFASIFGEETSTIALKTENGTEKEIYAKWQELAEKEVRP